jgi:penicillin-binding protein 1A
MLLDIGTASIARTKDGYGYGLKDIPVAGKTGTHINSTDLWFAGYSSAITCAVWVGLDKKETVYPDAFGRHTALPVWVDIMNASAANTAPEPVSEPENIQFVELCAVSGLLATESCLEAGPDPDHPERQKFYKVSYREYIRPESKIELRCTFHTGEDLVSTATAPVNPLLLAPAGNSILSQADARPLVVTAPVVIGEDPYQSITGGGSGSAAGPPVAGRLHDGSAPPVVPSAPIPNPGNRALLNPSPGKATVED